MAFVNEDNRVFRQKVKQRVGRGAGSAAIEEAGVVFDAVAEPNFADHLQIKIHPLQQALRLKQLAILLKECHLFVALFLDLLQHRLDALPGGHIVGGGKDAAAVGLIDHVLGERVQQADAFDGVAKKLHAGHDFFIFRLNVNDVALHPKRAALQRKVVAGELHLDQPRHDVVHRKVLSDFKSHHAVGIDIRRSQTIDAADRSDDDYIPPLQQGLGGRVAKPLDLLVAAAVFFNIKVSARHIGFRLIVVVVADKVFHRVFGEERPKLLAKLRGQRLVVRDDERGPLGGLDDARHGERLSRARGAEHRLKPKSAVQPLHQPRDGGGLVPLRTEVPAQPEGGVVADDGHCL